MILNTFAKESRNVAQRAQALAAELGSHTVEAEHLLLALTEQRADPLAKALATYDLDPNRVIELLDSEMERSLAAVGVSVAEFGLAPAPKTVANPRWANSAKLGLHRSSRIAEGRGDRRIQPAHLLLGLIRAPLGTVPRALDGGGVDRAELAARAEAILDARS